MKKRVINICKFLLMSWFFVGGGAYGYNGYIESTVYSSSSVQLSQDQLVLNVNTYAGPGGYTFNIFSANCTGGDMQFRATYFILPSKVFISGVGIPLVWTGNKVADLAGGWEAYATIIPNTTPCATGGSDSTWTPNYVNAAATGSLVGLPPGDYSYSMTYRLGNAFGATYDDVVAIIKAQGLNGASTQSQTTSFTGLAACAQDSPTSGAAIDFGMVTSNGTVQPGPLTTLGLVCNYDVALNDVAYSLTSNNPVTGEPSTGQNVAVALSNGAKVTLGGGNVTQPDPKRVSVNITPSIDTRGATAGEGTGSATLTFNYE